MNINKAANLLPPWMPPLLLALALFLHTKPAQAQDPGNGLSIEASRNGYEQNGIILGFLANATDEYDAGVDVPDPPLSGNSFLDLSLAAMSGAPSFFPRFRVDRRDAAIDLSSEAQMWTVTLRSDLAINDVDLTVHLGSELDPTAPLRLIEGDEEQDLRQDSTRTVLLDDNGEAILTLIIGTLDGGTVSLLHPGDGDSFYSGDVEQLQWQPLTSTTVTRTLLELSLDGGAAWSTLLDVDSMATTHSWQVPAGSNDQALARVTLDESGGTSISDSAAFSIVDTTGGSLDLAWTEPSGGELLRGGESDTLRWSWTGDSTQVNWVRLDYDLGDGLLHRIDSLAAAPSSYVWSLPNDLHSSQMVLHLQAGLADNSLLADSVTGLTLAPDTLVNGSYEHWLRWGPASGPPDDWSVGSGFGSSWSCDRVLDGIEGFYSARMNLTSSTTASLSQTQHAIVEGRHYDLIAHLQEDDPAMQGFVRLSFLGPGGNLLVSSESVRSSDLSSFQSIRVSATAPTGSALAKLEVVASGTGTLMADHLSFTQASTVLELDVTEPAAGQVLDYDGSTTLPVVWNYGASQASISGARLDVSLNGGSSWSTVSSFTDNSVRSYDWPGQDSYSTEVRMRVTAFGVEGDSVLALSDAFALRPTSRSLSLSSGWHLLSLPLSPVDSSLSALVGDDTPGAYFAFAYDSENGSNPQVDTLARGPGYWLALDPGATVDVQGTASLERHDQPLHSGWNLVGSAFPIGVERTTLLVAASNGDTLSYTDAIQQGKLAGDPIGFDPATGQPVPVQQGALLQPMKAYWVGALQTGLTLLVPPPVPGGTVPQVDRHPLQDRIPVVGQGWRVSLTASSNGIRSYPVRFGIDEEASAGFDPGKDWPAPPASPGGVPLELVIVEPEFTLPTGEQMLASLLHPDDHLQWDLRLTVQVPGDVMLDVSSLQHLRFPGYQFSLVHEGTVYPLGDVGQVLIEADGVEQLELLAEGLLDQSEPAQAPTPVQFALRGAAPNPFNSSTRLHLDLADRGEVILIAYDVTGRRVEQRSLGSMEAGVHRILWQPSSRMASGLYLVQLRQHRERATTRVLYLR